MKVDDIIDALDSACFKSVCSTTSNDITGMVEQYVGRKVSLAVYRNIRNNIKLNYKDSSPLSSSEELPYNIINIILHI